MSSFTLVLLCLYCFIRSQVFVLMYPYSWNLLTCTLQLVLLCSSHCLWSPLYCFTRSPSLLVVSSYSGLRSCDTNSLLHLNLHFAQAIMSWLRIVLIYSYVFSNCLVILLCFRRSDIFSCCTCTSIFDLVYLLFICLSCLIFLHSYLNFTVTKTDQRTLKFKECDRLRLQTSIKKSTQAFKRGKTSVMVNASFTLTETKRRKLICKECNRFELKTEIRRSTVALKSEENLHIRPGHRYSAAQA